MKYLSIFFVFVLGMNASAQNAVMVTSYDVPFILFGNDRQINFQPEKQVSVKNINTETYRLYVTFEDRSIKPVKKMVFMEPSVNETVRLRLVRKGRRRIKYKLKHGGWESNQSSSNYSSNSSSRRKPSLNDNYPAVPALVNVPAKGAGVRDIEGNYYPSIVINGVEWMAENLRTTRFSNNQEIPHVPNSEGWSEAARLNKGAYCVYNNNASNQLPYGNLYNWYVVDDSRGVCPQGWKVPSKKDAEAMIVALGGVAGAGRHMKTKGNADWTPPGNLQTNQYSTNQSGFNAKGSGSRFDGAGYSSFKEQAYYWCSDINVRNFNNDPNDPVGRSGSQFFSVNVFQDRVSVEDYFMSAGFSIRCIKE